MPTARSACALAHARGRRWRCWLLGIVLRGLLLDRPGLHPDEALYASWALRIADGSDPALLGVYVDKPPLLLYLLAGLFRSGRLRWAGAAGCPAADPGRPAGCAAGQQRQPGPAVADGPSRLRATRGPGRAGAVRPLAAGRAAVADPVHRSLAGAVAAAGAVGRAGAAGLAGRHRLRPGLRHQAAGAAVGAAAAGRSSGQLRWPMAPAPAQTVSARRLAWRWLNGFAMVAVAVLWWDSLRWQWMPSYWDRSAQTYGGVALALDAGLPQRLAQWGELLGYGFGWPLWLALGALVAWALFNRRGAWQRRQRHSLVRSAAAGLRRSYLLLHVATNLAPWDRYLLPLLPLLALLLARGALWAWDAIVDRAQPAGRAGWARTAAAAGLALGSALRWLHGQLRSPAPGRWRRLRRRTAGCGLCSHSRTARRHPLPPLAGLALQLLPLRRAGGAALVAGAGRPGPQGGRPAPASAS